MERLQFVFLQDLQVKFGLLTVEEEKERIVPHEVSRQGEFSGLGQKEVLIAPVSFSINKSVLDIIDPKKEGKAANLLELSVVHNKEDTFLKKIEQATAEKMTPSLKLKVLRNAAHPSGIRSYWNALRIVAYHSFKSRKIVQKGDRILPLKTKRQFEFHFRSQMDPERLGRYDSAFDEENPGVGPLQAHANQEAVLCFDGSKEPEFEAFHEYVVARICGKLKRQIKRNDTPPLLVWRQRFKDELTVFFKAKVGGNGYANDYQDSRVRELLREGRKIQGLNEADLVKKAFVEAIDSEKFSHREYTCMIARNRGYSFLAISRFTGYKTSEVKKVVENAIPKAAGIIYKAFCRRMKKPETDRGYSTTVKLVNDILLDHTKAKQ